MAETIYYYVDDFTDEVMPCLPSLASWAAWLVNPGSDYDYDTLPAKHGDVFAVSTIEALGDVQVEFTSDGWRPVTEVPEGANSYFLRWSEGSAGWDVENAGDSIAQALCELDADESPVWVACTRDGDGGNYRLLITADGPRLVQAGTQVYLAARYSRFPEMQAYRTELEAMGYQVTSRWINGDHQMPEEGSPEAKHAERIRFASEDYADIMAADIVVAFTEEPRKTNTRGGRHVEAGIALAAGKRLIVSGWRENVFYCLPQVTFCPDGWEEVKDVLGPCDGCSAIPTVEVDVNGLNLCQVCADGCRVPEGVEA